MFAAQCRGAKRILGVEDAFGHCLDDMKKSRPCERLNALERPCGSPTTEPQHNFF